MHSKCVKTGAQVLLEEYGLYIVTDLCELGDVYHFRVVSSAHSSYSPHRGYPLHATVHEIAIPPRSVPDVLLAHKNSTTYHGYEGKTV